MRSFIYTAFFVANSLMTFMLPTTAFAETFKTLCVTGTSNGGAHNNTWQKLNKLTGGSTWKAAGPCSSVPPPSCANGASDYPTCTPPLQPGIDLSGIPNPLVSTSSDPNLQQWAQLMFNTDGTWSAQTGDYDANYPSNGPNIGGRYLVNGAVATDYEIMISNFSLRNGSTGSSASGDNQDAFLNRWTNAGTGIPGYQPVFQGLYGMMGCKIDGDCVGGGNPTITFTVTVRRIDNHAQSASINMVMHTERSSF